MGAREDGGCYLSYSLGFHALMPPIATDTEPTDDPTSPENQPPEPERNTATAPDLIRQVHDTSRDIENRHRVMMKLVGIDPAEKAKQDAIFSYNIIDLTDLPLVLKNPYNPRPVVNSKVRVMRNALLEDGLRVFSNENRIMIVIEPSHVEPTCITSDPTSPPQKFRLKADAPLTHLNIIGGQHRRDAVILIKSDYQAKMERLQGSISSKKKALDGLVKQPPETDEAEQRKSQLESEIKALELDLADYETSMGFVGPWGVMLLDPGESYVTWWYPNAHRYIGKISKENLISLARNQKTVAYTETDGEKISMAMKLRKEVMLKREAGTMSHSHFLSIARTSKCDRRLVMVLEDPNLYEVLCTQGLTPITWMVSSQWSIAWLLRLLTSPSGGVRNMALCSEGLLLTLYIER
jgi:hypothetical protein